MTKTEKKCLLKISGYCINRKKYNDQQKFLVVSSKFIPFAYYLIIDFHEAHKLYINLVGNNNYYYSNDNHKLLELFKSINELNLKCNINIVTRQGILIGNTILVNNILSPEKFYVSR